MFDLQKLREIRAQLLDKADAITAMATDEKRDVTAEEKTELDAIVAKLDDNAKEIERTEKLVAYQRKAEEKRLTDIGPQAHGKVPGEPEKPKAPAIPKMSVRSRAFTGPDAAKEAFECSTWLIARFGADESVEGERAAREARQYCYDHGIGIRADAQTADDFSRGGALVPTALSDAIIRIVEDVGLARQLSRVQPMSTETLDVPKRSGGLTVYSPAEGAAITSSEATWSRVSLTVQDRATLTRISRKLLRSANSGVSSLVAEEIGFAFASQQDNEWINGDGTSTYFGELGLQENIGSAGTFTMATTSGDTWAETALTDISEMEAKLPSKYWKFPLCYVCSANYYHSVIVRLLRAAGGNTMETIQGSANGMFNGRPVYFTDQMPTATAVSTVHLMFGAFSEACMIGDRVGVEVASSTERYFDSDEVAIRGKVAYDINAHDIGDSSNAGAVVALKTGAAS